MRGSLNTANRRYYDFRLTFEPNDAAVAIHTMRPAVRIVRAYGWKDALGQAEREFGFDQVRPVVHPSNPGVATVYMDTLVGQEVVGQVTAEKA